MRESVPEAIRTITDVVRGVVDAAGPAAESLGVDPTVLAAGVGTLAILLLAGVVVRRRPSADVRRSRRRHERAQERAPPVDIGDIETAGVVEFSEHHSGERHAVCKVEGFVCFVEGVPSGVSKGDAIRFSILSFNRGQTSATATYEGRA